MRVQSFHQRALLVFGLSLACAVSFCYGTDPTFEVIGMGECADCAQNNIKTSDAISGLQVTIDCKAENGMLQTRGVGELDEDGNFNVSLPRNIVENGKLKEECYAQLHSASSAVCPAHGSLEESKIVLKYTADGKQTLGTAGKLKFSPVTCTSAFLWPHFKYPPLHKIPLWKKKFKYPFPPKFKEPEPKPEKPEPEPEKPKPKPEPEKPEPEPEKPKPKPKPEPEPEPDKPKPKPEPEPEPKFKKPYPEYKPKPFPKKPCPTFPKVPNFMFPPKYFPHPKFGKYPPYPPYDPHP